MGEAKNSFICLIKKRTCFFQVTNYSKAGMTMATDESVIKKRLLIEGDGGGDDKRISNLLKSFIKWASASESKEESERTFEKLQSQLAAVEFNFAKANLVYGMNVKENDNYEELYAKIDEDLKNAVVKIEDCKKELEKAKVIRKNRQEYDALAKIINEHPDRQATIDRIAALEKEHSVLKNTKAQLERKLEQRRRQFHLLVTSIHQLQALLDEDDEEESIEEEPTSTPPPSTTATTTIEAERQDAATPTNDEHGQMDEEKLANGVTTDGSFDEAMDTRS